MINFERKRLEVDLPEHGRAYVRPLNLVDRFRVFEARAFPDDGDADEALRQSHYLAVLLSLSVVDDQDVPIGPPEDWLEYYGHYPQEIENVLGEVLSTSGLNRSPEELAKK